MSDLGLNKIMAAALTTGLAILGLNAASDAFFEHEAPEEPGYFVEVAETGGGQGNDAPEWVPPTDYGVLLAEADAAAGEKKTAACVSCHTFEQGGANGTGPNLYDVVMRDIGATGGFAYSATLTEMEGSWDYAALDGFLNSPKKYAPGTAMNFAGLSKEKDRMNMIAYLRTLSASPADLPAPLPPEAFIEPTADDAEAEAEAEADAANGEVTTPDVVEAAVEEAEVTTDAVNADVVEAAEGVVEDASDAADEAAAEAIDAAETASDEAEAAVETVEEEVENATEN